MLNSENFDLIGKLAIAAHKNNIQLSVEQVIILARGLDDVKKSTIGGRAIIEIADDFETTRPKLPRKAAKTTTPDEIIAARKANARAIQQKALFVPDNKPAQPIDDINKRMEAAKMPDHANIQPAPVEKKPLTKAEKELYDYLQANPDATMPKICDALGISKANYYYKKYQIDKKGWKCGGVVYFPVKEIEND